MSHTHNEKYVSKMLIGFSLTTIGILLIFYTSFVRSKSGAWYLWGVASAVLINTGLYLLLNAFVHKVKSDLIKRQKMREQQKAPKEE